MFDDYSLLTWLQGYEKDDSEEDDENEENDDEVDYDNEEEAAAECGK